MSDDEAKEEELDLTSPDVVTKYKSSAEIVNKALQLVVSECKPKAKIVDICEKGDAFIREQAGNMYKNVKKKIERGVAFPTCISVNNIVCHFSPLAGDEAVLEENDVVKIDMGCHIDGFIAVVAHTHVLQEGQVTGRAADVIAAANTAAEVALRLVRPGKKMDKASLLGRVIEHVKDLKRKAVDASNVSTIPTEANVVTVESDGGYQNTFSLNDDHNLYIKASLCCDDRPDLFAELIEAFQRLRLRTIRADMTSLGGRIQNVFLLCRKDSSGSVCLNSLKESIKEALDRVASVDMVPSNAFMSKRQKLLQPRFPYSNISL